MRTINVELIIKVPSDYPSNPSVDKLLDDMEDRYGKVSLLSGEITGQSNDGES